MRITILFGGTNKERLVSVASAQALCEAIPDADLWFWDADDSVHETQAKTLTEHARPFFPMRDEIAAIRVVEIEPPHDREAVGVFAHRLDGQFV